MLFFDGGFFGATALKASQNLTKVRMDIHNYGVDVSFCQQQF